MFVQISVLDRVREIELVYAQWYLPLYTALCTPGWRDMNLFTVGGKDVGKRVRAKKSFRR